MTNQMKQKAGNFYWRFIALLFAAMMSIPVFAQEDKKIDVDIDTDGDSASGIFSQPWVWVVGGAVFILLLVALLRNNKK